MVLAGYAKEMDALVARNPGLKSRFPNVLFFDDYSGVELVQIGM